MHSLIRNSIVALSLVAFSAFATAATTVPNTFTAGMPAKAADVNANFQALATAIDTLSARVDKLDGTTPVTAADLVGTYSLLRIGTTMSTDVNSVNTIITTSVNGVATVALDGTYVVSSTIQQITQSGGTTTVSSKAGGGTGTWSLSNGKVTWQGISETLSVLSGGRLLVGAGEVNPGEKSLIMFIRN